MKIESKFKEFLKYLFLKDKGILIVCFFVPIPFLASWFYDGAPNFIGFIGLGIPLGTLIHRALGYKK